LNILALDTSTSLASVAICSDTAIIAETVFICDRSLSARLVPEIDRLLNLAGLSVSDIDLFAASIGPGSFTGVRCGVATIQGLALASEKPCAGFSSLAILAMNFSLNSHPVCTLLDARKNEVYAALYDCSTAIPAALIADSVMPVEKFLDLVSPTSEGPVIFAGEGARRYQDTIISLMGDQARFASPLLNAGRAAHGAVLALNTYHLGKSLPPSQLLPTYIRASDAEIARTLKEQIGHTTI
jgi:tRNA threonylcarbamoyladenosine biosynthesis protein TsaB